MNNDVIMLVIAVVGLLTTFAITLYLVGYFRSTSESDNEQARGGADANARNLNRGGRRGLRNRRLGAAVVDENAEQGGEDIDAGDADDDDSPRAVGASRKAMQKELKRQERERMRKFEESRREELKRRREAKEEAHRKRLEADELARGAQDEDEFGKRRSFHSADTTRADANLGDGTLIDSELLHEIAEYIEGQKVVVLDEVADDFGLRTDVVKQCVEKLVASGCLSGILDDRGNFISISDQELSAVASFIQAKGRVTLHELGVECTRLVGLP